MQKNMLPVLVTSLILPCSLLTMDQSSSDNPEPMTIRAVLSPENNQQNIPESLTESTLVAAIDRLTPDKMERVLDKLSQKLSQSDSDSAPSKKSSSTPSPRKPQPLPEHEKGMPTLIDSALSIVASNTTMTQRLLYNGSYSPQNATHTEVLEGALRDVIANDDQKTFFQLVALLQANEKCKKQHGNLIQDSLAKSIHNWLNKHHLNHIKKSNETIENAKKENYTHFNTATAVFIKAIDQAITEYTETVQNKCGKFDTVVSNQQKELAEKRQQLESIKMLNSSIHGDLKILTDKKLNQVELNPGLTQFEQHKHRLNSMRRNSAIPALDIPQNQQLALTDK